MKSKTKLLVYLLLPICITNAYAQRSMAASGRNGSNLNNSIEQTGGKVIYTTYSGPTGLLDQTVQQPYTIATLGLDDFPNISLQIIAYPNTTTTSINLNIEDLTPDTFDYHLFDSKGDEISSQNINKSDTPISSENLPLATYFLNVSDHIKIIKKFKIIKNK